MTTASGSIDRPILIVSTPRSGSTLLFEQLARAPHLFTTGSESHRRIEQIADFAPHKRGWSSNRLDAEDASSGDIAALTHSFYEAAVDRDGKPADGPVRILEKTPKNALRIPFFAQAWPDSIFVYLHRKPRPAMASMIEGWVSGRFRTYPVLPGWSGYPWSFNLVPGWRDLIGKPLPEIVARQWAITTDIMIDDLSAIAPDRVRALDYDAFIANPQPTLAELAASLDLGWDQDVDEELPFSSFTVSPPAADKWRRLEHLIAPVAPIIADAEHRAADFLVARG